MPDNFIHHLYVATAYQGKGIGTQLLDEVVTRISSPITLKCVKRNTKATKFYLRNGWIPKLEANSKEGTYILFEYVKGRP